MAYLTVLDSWLRLVSEVLHEEDEDDGGNAEDETGEADHDRGDDVMEPHGGRDQVPVPPGGHPVVSGHIGVQLLQPVHSAHVPIRHQPLESEK